MPSDLLITGVSQLATTSGTGAARGRAMRDLTVIDDAAMSISGGKIAWVGKRSEWSGPTTVMLDLGGHAVVPALIDPHTHAVWAGDRLADFEARAAGVPYELILAKGGGIRRTITDTSVATSEDLAALAAPRIAALVASGAATIEIKSGYGFSTEGELASIHAIHLVASRTQARIVPTLLIHVPPRDASERDAYLEMVTKQLIPDVGWQRLAEAVDVFIERESFQVDEARAIFTAAKAAGMPIKAHVDQFHAIGGLELALEFNALSVDHLEASGPSQVAALAASSTIGVILPGVTLHLGLPAAPARALIDSGAAIAIASDLNPGSSPVYSTQLAMALGVRLNGLLPAEALTASTANAAAALGHTDAGRLAPGQRADFLVLGGRDWRDITYALGTNPIARMFIGGREVTA